MCSWTRLERSTYYTFVVTLHPLQRLQVLQTHFNRFCFQYVHELDKRCKTSL